MPGTKDKDRQVAGGQTRRLEDDRLGAVDSDLLHPANEGHDAERARDRLETWASQEGDRGPDARALRELQQKALAEGAPLAEVLPLEPPTPPPTHMRGSAYNADENARDHHTHGGEPKKHPRPPAETTPEPRHGPNRPHTVTGEPPRVEPAAGGGVHYEPGEVPAAGKRRHGPS